MPAYNVGLVKTAQGKLHAYCNIDANTLFSNRYVKSFILYNNEIVISEQIFKYKENCGME